MAVDATGTPTSPDSIPTYNTAADNPSGKGLNNIVAAVQTGLTARLKLTGAPTVTGQVPIWNNGTSQWVPGTVAAGATYIRKNTSTAVNTTVAATDLLAGAFTVPANAMGVSSFLRLTASGDWLNNTGGATTLPRFQLVLGGTTLIDTGSPAAPTVGSGALRAGWTLEATITAENATNLQTVSFRLFLAGGQLDTTAGGANFTTGTGMYQSDSSGGSAPTNNKALGVGTGALDMTTSKTLVLNVINASASASYETKLNNALAEII